MVSVNNNLKSLYIDGKPVRKASLGGKVFFEKHEYELTVSASEPIIQIDEETTITANLTDYGEPVAGETVLIYDSDNVKHNDPVIILGKKEYESVSLLCRGEGEITFTGCDILYIYDGTNLIRNSSPNPSLTFKITVSNNVLKFTESGDTIRSYNLTESEVTLVFNSGVNIIDDSWEHFYYEGVTDSNGEVSVGYVGKGTGDLNIKVDCMNLQETYSLEDCQYWNDGSSVGSLEIPSGASVTTNGDYLTIGATSVEKLIYIPVTLSNSDNWEFSVKIALRQQNKVVGLIFNDNSYYASSYLSNGRYYWHISSNRYFNVNATTGDIITIRRQNGVTAILINDNELDSKTVSHKSSFKCGFYTYNQVQYVDDLKIKSL